MYTSVATQPDITFAVLMLSQFLENLGEAHWEVVKQVFRYLAGMCGTVLTYGEKDMISKDLLMQMGPHRTTAEPSQAIHSSWMVG
jgi:hypothetical protein